MKIKILLSGPRQGQELEYLENADPEEVFAGLVLMNLKWKTILPASMDSVLQEKWLLAERRVREEYSSLEDSTEEEDLSDFLPEWKIS